MVEKRQKERRDRMIVIEFRQSGSSGQYYAGITHNCSDEGFSFESEALDLLSGNSLEFKLKHPEKDLNVNFTGDLAWTTKQNYGLTAGVKFHSVAEEKQKILTEIISLSPSLPASTSGIPPTCITEDEILNNDPAKTEPDMITESIMSAVEKKTEEETEIDKTGDIPPAVTPAMPEKSVGIHSTSDKPRIASRMIAVLALIAASAISIFFLFSNNNALTGENMAQKNELPPISSKPINRTLKTVNTKQAEINKPALSIPKPMPEKTLHANNRTAIKDNEIELPSHLTAKDAPAEQSPAIVAVEDEKSIPKKVLTEDSIIPEMAEPNTGNKFIVHVSAWKTLEYATDMNKKVRSLYPGAVMVFENDFHIVMIPNIPSRKDAEAITTDLTERLNVSPLIHVQKRELPGMEKNGLIESHL